MSPRLRTAFGVARSLRIYYLHRRGPRMRAFYAALIGPGDLAFDIGSHVGDRIGCFRRLGARVVAVEPQPALARTLRWLYGRDAGVSIQAIALGRESGRASLHLNLANPTVSTASADFVTAARGSTGWEGQAWDGQVEVACQRLDDLIARHGRPVFVKIDVEGFESEVLAGLSAPVPALSFEITTIQRSVARAALDECRRLGYSRFNAVLSESYRFEHARWLDADAIEHWIQVLPHAANSGDVYAVVSGHRVLV